MYSYSSHFQQILFFILNSHSICLVSPFASHLITLDAAVDVLHEGQTHVEGGTSQHEKEAERKNKRKVKKYYNQL